MLSKKCFYFVTYVVQDVNEPAKPMLKPRKKTHPYHRDVEVA